ncbi:hypothetical protein [Salmonella enterica]|uniref:hypothetical protein n=1 Tax=Salmonella enterica TaxID=28901 RepID=UPI0003BC9CD0|nr:hypothetical protein [Salmonella enterica]APV88251.1 hypothetical protein SEEM1958_009950 [Salmonella enterica subsp. enterica serovar Mbandaka str. ATCC 51958]EBF8302818.1 hypothetical protein [Salmonella enterica subsp. enterica serovar Mbandaka]
MMLQIDFWEVISMALSFLGVLVAAGKMLLTQIEKRLNERFEALEAARKESETGWSRLEREFLEFRADMPLNYVRREDYIRGQTVIEAKLDALYNKIELSQGGGR